jgi:DNA-binding MarR family transcriptional regulator
MELTAGGIEDATCACAALRRASRAATQLYDLVLEPSGLKTTQFTALKTIAEAGELPQWRFARDHALAVETLSRRLAALRKKGLIAVRTGKNHGERIYTLTAQGREALSIALPYWQRAQQRFKHMVGEREWSVIMEACRRAVEGAQKAEQLRTTNSTAIASPVA